MSDINLIESLITNYCTFRFSYAGQETTRIDKEKFLNYFSIVSWQDLSESEKSAHKYMNCSACYSRNRIKIYTLFKRNAKELKRNTYDDREPLLNAALKKAKDAKTVDSARKNAMDFIKEMESTVGRLEETWGEGSVQKLVSHEHDQALVKEVLTAVGRETADTTNNGILANNLSYNQHNAVRHKNMLSNDNKENQPTAKPYVIKHDRFKFDHKQVHEDITQELQQKGKVKWAELARKHSVLHLDGKPASNGNQVLKAFAVDKGLIEANEQKRTRRTKRKLDVRGLKVDLSLIYPTQDALKEITRSKIALGIWDIGTPIVPITLQYKKINNHGIIHTSTMTLSGRTFSLQKIMDRTLREHEKAGILRKCYPLTEDITTARADLATKGVYKND